jgi:hypothetical protein
VSVPRFVDAEFADDVEADDIELVSAAVFLASVVVNSDTKLKTCEYLHTFFLM